MGSLLLSATDGATFAAHVFWMACGLDPAHPLASHVLTSIPVQVLPEKVLETALPDALGMFRPPARVVLPE